VSPPRTTREEVAGEPCAGVVLQPDLWTDANSAPVCVHEALSSGEELVGWRVAQ
jgi:hypothetical protein